MTEHDRRKTIALAEYKEVVAQFRALTNIRFKLLTYLPLGTAALATFISKESALALTAQPAVAAFALVVTVCIATYDKRNDQHYDELVGRAAQLEREELGLSHGVFSHRPRSWLKYGRVSVEHRWPIGLIYAAAAALWAYLLVDSIVKNLSVYPRPVWPAVFASVLVISGWALMRELESSRSKKLRGTVRSLMNRLMTENASARPGARDALIDEISRNERLFGLSQERARQRVNYHWGALGDNYDCRSASLLLGAVIDLPARWIEDIWSGRRG